DALRAQVPEVMMGVADGQLRLQGRFLGEGQPVIASVRHNGLPLQDVAAHAEHTAAGHQWGCARMVCRSSPLWPDSIARKSAPNNGSLPLLVKCGEAISPSWRLVSQILPLCLAQLFEARERRVVVFQAEKRLERRTTKRMREHFGGMFQDEPR